MSPALNGSSTLERFERSNAGEIRNRIMFDFYPGLPQMQSLLYVIVVSLSGGWLFYTLMLGIARYQFARPYPREGYNYYITCLPVT